MEYIAQDLPKAGDTVVVGMSGGVDSTLTALLLKERGCHVIGTTMSMWDGSIPEIRSEKTVKDACFSPGEQEDIEECKKFCAANNIEYHVIDVAKEYKAQVVDYFKSEYRKGRTPNPCIRCNRYVKFGALLEGIKKLDIQYDYFCTGHYAKIVRPTSGILRTDKTPCMIATATDITKDQTYFLYRLPSEILEKVRFPLATITKKEVFELAHKANLKAADRAESQDFIGAEYFDVLFSDKPSVPGDIIDLDGKVLGRHKGIEHYTIGQRKGLGVALNYPAYVQAIDAKNNVVVLAPNDALNSSGLIADEFVWPANVEPQEPITAFVKIRLASRPVEATIETYTPQDDEEFSGKAWKIMFKEEQRAVAPGQSVVLYQDNVIVGGGIISKVIK